MAGGVVFAQESDTKKINTIKRNSQYIYAEATMDTEAEAYQVAEELLTTYVSEYIESRKKLNQAENVIVKDIASSCSKIQMMRGEMYRVFVYVKKTDIIPADNAITLVKTEVPASPADTATIPPAQVAGAPEPLAPVAETPEPTAPEAEVTEQPIPAAEAPKLNQAWQQAAIDELLAAKSLTDAKMLMNRLRVEFKIKRYGTYDECKNPSECFWLIASDEGKVLTILGPGMTQRTNFKTLQYDSLQNYTGKNAIWFTLSK